jgi:hypothetical protein
MRAVAGLTRSDYKGGARRRKTPLPSVVPRNGGRFIPCSRGCVTLLKPRPSGAGEDGREDPAGIAARFTLELLALKELHGPRWPDGLPQKGIEEDCRLAAPTTTRLPCQEGNQPPFKVFTTDSTRGIWAAANRTCIFAFKLAVWQRVLSPLFEAPAGGHLWARDSTGQEASTLMPRGRERGERRQLYHPARTGQLRPAPARLSRRWLSRPHTEPSLGPRDGDAN